jgi:hypothetical protein
MLAEQSLAPGLVGSRTVGPRLGKHLDAVASRVDRHQTKTNQSAEAVHTPIPIPTAPARRDREPNLIRHAHAVDRLQQQFEAEPEFHLHNGDLDRHIVAHGDNIAAIDLTLDAETRSLEEALYGRIQGGLGHSA